MLFRSGDYYGLYSLGTDASNPIENGEYVISIKDKIMPNVVDDVTVVWGSGFVAEDVSSNSILASNGAPYTYLGIEADSINEYSFISQGNGKYYIQHKETGKYLYIYSGWLRTYDSPQALTVTPNADGSIVISYASFSGTYYVSLKTSNGATYISCSATNNEDCKIWLYSKNVPVSGGEGGDTGGSNDQLELYNALHAGIAEDYSTFTRESFEELLRKLENGVAVFSDYTSSSADYRAATEAIYAAIDTLEIDIKKIDGTLFKYGYSNANGTPDYSNGGKLMNDIAVKQMKNAILADMNLVNQIKEIIGYDNPDMGWTGNQADEVLDGVAEAYARIYTLQFTGTAYNGAENNAASNYEMLQDCTWIPVSLWNLWTKDNTHGANDPGTIHDGASVQGLPGSTLNKGVVTSHSAFSDALSYANDGPSAEHDITKYSYGFNTSSGWKTVTLEYLSGISV